MGKGALQTGSWLNRPGGQKEVKKERTALYKQVPCLGSSWTKFHRGVQSMLSFVKHFLQINRKDENVLKFIFAAFFLFLKSLLHYY